MAFRAFCCLLLALDCIHAFTVRSSASNPMLLSSNSFHRPSSLSSPVPPRRISKVLKANDNDKSQGEEEFDIKKALEDGSAPVIMRGSASDDLDESIWEDLETGQPPQWVVTKEVSKINHWLLPVDFKQNHLSHSIYLFILKLLGIGGFTYLLAAFIIFFGSMNFILGPGWLGGSIGVPGTGSINEMSDSLPNTVDLSSPEYRL